MRLPDSLPIVTVRDRGRLFKEDSSGLGCPFTPEGSEMGQLPGNDEIDSGLF